MIPFVKVDGRPEPFTKEKLDCTVRAVMTAAEIDYPAAHSLLAYAGRKYRHKMNSFKTFMNASPLGTYRVREMKVAATTLNQFIQDHGQGRYIVRKRGHVFAVIDGVVYDRFSQAPRVRIKNVWELSK